MIKPSDFDRATTNIPYQELKSSTAKLEQMLPAEMRIGERIDNYLQLLSDYQVDELHQALAGQGILTYLDVCLRDDQPWNSTFLFKPTINPAEFMMQFGERELPAIDHFAHRHRVRGLTNLSQLLLTATEQPSVIFIKGCMFSFKSGEEKLAYGTLNALFGEENVHAFIYDGMGESQIHARSLPGLDIPAKRVDTKMLADDMHHIIDRQRINGGRLVTQAAIIEEATFFAADRASANEFADVVEEARQTGITVILGGLDKNYKAEDLPVTCAIQERVGNFVPYQCESYHLHHTAAGVTMSAATLTGRYNTQLDGMFDWLLPVLIPREYGTGMVEYHPLPDFGHPLNVIAQNNPELYAVLKDVQDQDLYAKQIELVKLQES